MSMVAMAVFVCIGGHRIVMAGLLDTFQTIPPGGATVPESISEAFVMIVSESFRLGIRAAVPVVTALLLSTLVLGLISRTLPQLNILMVGFGLNAMLAFATTALTLGAAVWAFQERIEPTLDVLLEALHGYVRPEWLS
jgi:flagellar biosynthetic protein FliR